MCKAGAMSELRDLVRITPKKVLLQILKDAAPQHLSSVALIAQYGYEDDLTTGSEGALPKRPRRTAPRREKQVYQPEDAFITSFENGGQEALDRLRDEDPKAFFQIFRDLFPRQVEQRVDATNVEYATPDVPPAAKDYMDWLEHRRIEAEFLRGSDEAVNAG